LLDSLHLERECFVMTVDIDAAFDGIVLAEDNLVKTGFKEGFTEGHLEGGEEGFSLGLEKGSEFGQELGFYKGFAEAWIQHLQADKEDKHNRALTQLAKLVKNIENFPCLNDPEVDVGPILSDIRSRFKTVCSLLGIKQENSNSEISW